MISFTVIAPSLQRLSAKPKFPFINAWMSPSGLTSVIFSPKFVKLRSHWVWRGLKGKLSNLNKVCSRLISCLKRSKSSKSQKVLISIAKSSNCIHLLSKRSNKETAMGKPSQVWLTLWIRKKLNSNETQVLCSWHTLLPQRQTHQERADSIGRLPVGIQACQNQIRWFIRKTHHPGKIKPILSSRNIWPHWAARSSAGEFVKNGKFRLIC